MKPKVSIIVNSPHFSYSANNSAVANYLNTLKTALVLSGYIVNTFPINSNLRENNGSNNRSKRGLLKRLLSYCPFCYNSLAFTSYLRNQKKNQNEFLAKAFSADIIIEFLSFGSDIARLHTSKSSYIVIFDSPASEQYIEMYKSKSIWHKKLKNSEKNSLSSADKIICYSKCVSNYIRKLNVKIPIEIIPCIYWKGEIDNRPHQGINIGFIGSFLSWHKVELLVYAFERIKKHFSNIKLYLIGYGEEWNKIKMLVEKLECNKDIVMTGYVSELELESLKSQMDIGVMPGSNWYGSPLKLFEYAESGIPIIAPQTPTVEEYFKHDYNCLLIQTTNELDSLTEHLTILLNNPDLRQKLASQAKKMMQTDFAKDVVMAKFVNLVNDTLKSNEKPKENISHRS